MRKRNAESLSEVLGQFLHVSHLETPLLEYRLVQSWPNVAGKLIASHTGEIYIRNQKLHVRIDSSALRSEVQMGRSELVRKLNEGVGSIVIYDIIVY